LFHNKAEAKTELPVDGSLQQYVGIIFLGILGAGFLIGMLLLSVFIGPRNKTKTKQLPFECGSVSVGNVRSQRFNIGFYLVAMLFILFDIEIIFMYPWALLITELKWQGIFEMAGFMGVLALGFVYVWGKGVLSWND
jgi:NADH-quinone oxidoreductase subunit A